MKVTRIFAALALVAGFAGAAHAQNGCARLSWGSCDPWNENKNFTTATTYQLVYSAFGVSAQNVGTDSNVHVGGSGAVPDAWRFDAAGCQGATQLTALPNPFSKACPALTGANPLTITNYALDGSGEGDLRLAVTYDVQTPNPATRYTVWLITFDHTFSNVGPTPPDNSSCGGAEKCENLSLTNAMLLANSGQQLPLGNCGDTDPKFPGVFASGFALWNGGCPPVATQPSTWGHLKGLYH